MTFLHSFFNRGLALLAVIAWLCSCTPLSPEPPALNPMAKSGRPLSVRLAVLPVANFGKTPAPLKEIRGKFSLSLRSQGLDLLDEELLDSFLERHRIRYTGGVTERMARELQTETGADALLVTSLELFSETPPPKVALTARLVAGGADSKILWMDSVALAGDDAPGLFAVNLVNNPRILLQRALDDLATALSRFVSGMPPPPDKTRTPDIFQPKEYFISPLLTAERPQRVAVVPFYNLSDSPNAGDIMATHFTSGLRKIQNFEVIEPGKIRETLLNLRIVMDDGISFSTAELISKRLDADLILTGKVLEYKDYHGSSGQARVDFTAMLFEINRLEMIWSARSYNDGDETISYFKRGKVTTAHALASRMVTRALMGIGR